MKNAVSVLEGAYSQMVKTDIYKSLIMEIRPINEGVEEGGSVQCELKCLSH